MIAPRHIRSNHTLHQTISQRTRAHDVIDPRSEVVDPAFQLRVEAAVRVSLGGMQRAEAVDHPASSVSGHEQQIERNLLKTYLNFQQHLLQVVNFHKNLLQSWRLPYLLINNQKKT